MSEEKVGRGTLFAAEIDDITKDMLAIIADMKAGETSGAVNIRKDGHLAARQNSDNIVITTKEDLPGIDINVAPGTKGEQVHIPVVLTESGLNDKVYNDFYIGEGADVYIVAGCGIHNDGCETSEHDGIHRFFLGKGSRVVYLEKHYGEGAGFGWPHLEPCDRGPHGRRFDDGDGDRSDQGRLEYRARHELLHGLGLQADADREAHDDR